MTKEELLKRLKEIKDLDMEERHVQADILLIYYINDPDIATLYYSYDKWYA